MSSSGLAAVPARVLWPLTAAVLAIHGWVLVGVPLHGTPPQPPAPVAVTLNTRMLSAPPPPPPSAAAAEPAPAPAAAPAPPPARQKAPAKAAAAKPAPAAEPEPTAESATASPHATPGSGGDDGPGSNHDGSDTSTGSSALFTASAPIDTASIGDPAALVSDATEGAADPAQAHTSAAAPAAPVGHADAPPPTTGTAPVPEDTALPADSDPANPTLLARASTKELLFGHNNSSLRVATSVRGGTIHRLHVSEFGKICAKFPQKAEEVVTGSFQAVPLSGVIVVESTAEGTDGEFYKMCQRAQALVTGKGLLTRSQYRFHFYAWWQDPSYTMEPDGVAIPNELVDYFNEIEQLMDCKIDGGQRAWYAEKQRNDFAGAEERMWREYPSTPAEAFQQSVAGNYFAKELMALRKRGGITQVPTLDLPVYTFWDIGNSDGCAIWFMQVLNQEDRFIWYYEGHNEDLRHYAHELQKRGYLYGGHFLPHDANHKRLSDYNKSTMEQLQQLMPGQSFFIVPVVSQLMTGIYAARKHLKTGWFDLDGTKEGIERLTHYKKKWSSADARYLDATPDKSNGCSEGADAYRQYAQAKELGLLANLATSNRGYTEAPAPVCY